MKKRIWDLYAPIYEKAMRADKKLYQFILNYSRQCLIIASTPEKH